MKRNLLIIAVLAIVATGCYKEPFADARISPNPGFVEEDIAFFNLSLNSYGTEWDLGDGRTAEGDNLIIQYDIPGIYDITLDAFGKKGDVSRAYFILEVKGDLKVIVKEYYQEYTVAGASVRLYPSLEDWNEETNLVAEGFTDADGEVIFADLQYQRYYLDVYETWHDNYTLAAEDVAFIETPPIHPDTYYEFIAYVDVYDTPSKSAAKRTERRAADLEKAARESRNLEDGSNVREIEKKK